MVSKTGHLITYSANLINYYIGKYVLGLPWWLSGKESACQYRRHRFDLLVGKIPSKKKWQPAPVFLAGKSYR